MNRINLSRCRCIPLQLLSLAFAVSAVGMFSPSQSSVIAAETNDRPNIIFILADDMGIGDVSHNGGLAPTPHLDRLAAGGMRLTDAHTTSSVCTPTRYGILTGRYNWRSRLKSGVLYGPDQPLIPTERSTIAKFLQDRGYRTGVVGKWHLGLGWQAMPEGELYPGTPEAERSRPLKELKKSAWTIDYARPVTGGPNQLGFDQSFIIPASLDMFPYVYLRNGRVVEEPTTVKAFHRPGPAAAGFEAVNCLRDFARESRQFIASSGDQPFFLYLPLSSPHTPIVPSPAWQGKSKLSEYGDFVMETDWVVGQVLEQLDELNATDNTLILFTTDNGCSPQAKIPELQAKGHSPNGNLRGHKADIFDGGHRVPFLVHWPNVVTAGTQSDQLVSTVDAFSTFADVIGAKIQIPNDAAEDSFSFLPILQGTDEAIRPYLIHHSINGSFAIRQGRWKLSLCPGSGGWSDPRPPQALKDKTLPPVQLYDMQSDIAESNNLIEQQPDIADSLADLLVEAIANGRTTPGEKVSNEGWPQTFPGPVLKLYPHLQP
ncbi:sulfatase family protein [Neorhodopirellula pilleata]|uniref:Arylsulfatase n=1 Tax=Neorhodopirellula pilleata TaxID=2714738 RepID=A0A5C6ADM6_9BACT|nr:arylsulfatase [Neorhodopirellula pilleata]TWT97506.1 Arylsulfatase [Neorhodopirellula pilleata]